MFEGGDGVFGKHLFFVAYGDGAARHADVCPRSVDEEFGSFGFFAVVFYFALGDDALVFGFALFDGFGTFGLQIGVDDFLLQCFAVEQAVGREELNAGKPLDEEGFVGYLSVVC